MAEKSSRGDRSTARKTTSGSTEGGGRKRDSRAGTRKVTSLSAEQLERKRANDREAQRTIRQRTKEHIEKLESQVAELSARDEQIDRVLERNAALEAEIAHLRQQLSILSNRTFNSVEDEDDSRRSSTSSTAASIMSSPFNSPHAADSLPVAPSLPGRMSLSHTWQAYPVTRPSSGGDGRSNGEVDVGTYAMGDPLTTATMPPTLNGYVMPAQGQYSVSDTYQTLYVPGAHSKARGYSMRQTLGDRQGPTSAMHYVNGAAPTTSVQGYQGADSVMSNQPNLSMVGYQWPPQS